MSSIVSRIFTYQTVIASAIVFMILNTFLPLPSLQAEATKYPFKLKITLEKDTFELKEPINITWILINISDENVTLYTSIDRVFDFLILDKNFKGVYYYRSNYGWTHMILPSKPIKPGANKTETGSWDQTYGQTYIPTEFRLKSVLSGIYYVEGIFHSPTYGLTIKTPMIQITIL